MTIIKVYIFANILKVLITSEDNQFLLLITLRGEFQHLHRAPTTKENLYNCFTEKFQQIMSYYVRTTLSCDSCL